MDNSTQQELHLVHLLLKRALLPGEENAKLYNMLQMVNLKVKGTRCSLVRVHDYRTGVVVASNDSKTIAGRPVNLMDYPELQAVMNTAAPVVITNINESPILTQVREKIKAADVDMIFSFPVYYHEELYGALSLRTGRKNEMDAAYIEKFGMLAAHIISLALSAETGRGAA